MTNAFKSILIDNLKTLRKAKGLTQNDVAEYLKISNATYNKYENENVSQQPSLENLVSLADLFNISSDELLGRDFSPDGSALKKLKVRIEIEKEVGRMFDEIVKNKRNQVIEDTLAKLKNI